MTRKLLCEHFPRPEIADYWELAKELSDEREVKREQKRSASQRRQAAEAFVSRKRNADGCHDTTASLPVCFRTLGFKEWPKSKSQIKRRYHQLALTSHPDMDAGDCTAFKRIDDAFRLAIDLFDRVSPDRN